jgi:transposase InsO family protein
VHSGNSVCFEGDECQIKSQVGDVIGRIPVSENALYKVEHEYAGSATIEQVDILTLHKRLGHISADAIRALVLNNAVTGLQLLNPNSSFTCDSCEYAKATRKPIKKERTNAPAKTFGEEIHSDLWGPSPISTIGGRKYYISFTDDYSRYTSLDLLKYKDEALSAYKGFAAWVQNQLGVRIKRLRSDRGGEYTGHEFTKFLQEQGTERRLTTHDTPQHNGVAEALNRRLFERVRAILHHSQLPKSLWGEAVMFAVWLKNRTSTRTLGDVTPFERLYGDKPNLAGVPEWGQRIWVHSDKGTKLDARAVECRWVGYDRESTHAHRVYWPEKHRVSVERNIKFVRTSVTIYSPSPSVPGAPPITTQTQPPPAPPAPQPPVSLVPPASSTTPPIPPTPHPTPISTPRLQPPVATESGEEEMPEEEEEEEVEREVFTPPPVSRPTIASKLKGKAKDTGESIRRSQRIAERTKRTTASESSTGKTILKHQMPGGLPIFRGTHPDYKEPEGALYAEIKDKLEEDKIEGLEISEQDLVVAAVEEIQDDPKTLQEAKSRSDWPLWKEAMDKELATLEKAGTWTTVDRPQGKNVVGSKWVYRIKRKADGSVDKYKARLVARGFTQIFGVDYYNTFSPVAKLASFRAVLALAARFDWEIKSFDFNGAYLNGELDEDEEIYMQAPPGYESQGEHKVKRLRKSLYGLKQAGRKWYDALSRALAKLGFRTSHADPGVFYTRYKGHILILVVHVDDCIFTGSSPRLLEEYKAQFHARYALTDLGPVSWLLGIKITRDRSTRSISLSQSSYIDSILARFALGDAKAQATPMVPGAIFSRSDSPSNPTDIDRMKKVPYREAIGSLMYASVATRPDISFAVSTLSQFLDNPGDAHWIGVKRIFRYLAGTRDVELTYGAERHDLIGYTDADGATQEHRRAISGNAFLIDGGAISWSSRKQELVTLSTAEAEYVAATHAAKETLWLRKLVHELFPSLIASTPLYCDNQAAIKLIEDDNYHARTKHIDIRYHFIRYTVQSGALDVIYCPTEDMVADILTKALPKWKTIYHNSTLGLRSRHA